ncbi:hypothetical protein GW17_00007355 [Ensete ventricosum]|nr:hypothetical protein GW17_00007355 [Ensete ventricosum]
MNRKPGDWTCRSCQHLNFSRRDSCQRCSDSRPSSDRSEYASFGGSRIGGSSFGFSGSDVRPGDWYCSCGAHNFASRSSCFKCCASKEDSAVGGGGGGFDGDMPRSRGYGFGGSGGGGRAGWKDYEPAKRQQKDMKESFRYSSDLKLLLVLPLVFFLNPKFCVECSFSQFQFALKSVSLTLLPHRFPSLQ